MILVAHIHGMTERHLRARKDWPAHRITHSDWGRDARNIGHDRPLPYLKDLLRAGMDRDKSVVVTNDDCSFSPGAFDYMEHHCRIFQFGCVRRDASHIGREAAFFDSDWLREHLDEMPDVILCIDRWDLVIAKWLRAFHGYKTTMENLMEDLFPAEAAPGLIIHEDHPSYWTGIGTTPAALHNARLWDAGK